MMKSRRIILSFASEFSPSQVDLVLLLELAGQYGGDAKAFEEAIRNHYYDKLSISDQNKRKRAYNVKLSMRTYGIIDDRARLTEFGSHLYSVRQDAGRLYADLARHILLRLHGIALIQCVSDRQASGEVVDLLALRAALEERGISVPSGSSRMSIMWRWLSKAGVVGRNWTINQQRLEVLIGKSEAEIEALAVLTPQQRAFLRTLASLDGPGPYRSNNVKDLAEATYGVKFNEKALASQVLNPLQQAGYITLRRTTSGRGSRPFDVTGTAKLDADVVEPLLQRIEEQVGVEMRPLLRKPLTEILQELRPPHDSHTRGLALEALAFKLMRSVDLTFVGFRKRGPETGGAEVDVIFEGSRLVFSRWQVQCKNVQGGVDLEDVAKEVGLTHMLKSNVIVIVSTGSISPQARSYANAIMRDSNLCIIMIDGNDIGELQRDMTAILSLLNREAKHAMTLKRLSPEVIAR